MSQDTNNTPQGNEQQLEAGSNKLDTISAVESVYPADTIALFESADLQQSLLDIEKIEPGQAAANDDVSYPDIYSLNSARRSKHEKSIERRASKSRLTDRRSAARVSANGEEQADRRADNGVANIQSLRES